jgi:hypothetical protein
MSQLRAQEAPAPNVYYYGLFDNCGACIGTGGQRGSGCLLGVAPGSPGSSPGEASQRVAIGVTRLSSSRDVGPSTFVHEIGHTQGRNHVQCAGATAANIDLRYPHEGGKIGVWGFGVRDFEVRNPDRYTDYMSYCDPTWVSDWQWSATFDRIREVTAFDSASMASLNDAILVGMVNTESGQSTWWTDRGTVDPSVSPAHAFSLAFEANDRELPQTAVDVDAWSEGPLVTVRTPLPANFDEDVAGIRLRAPGIDQQIPKTAIRRFHASDRLRTP